MQYSCQQQPGAMPAMAVFGKASGNREPSGMGSIAGGRTSAFSVSGPEPDRQQTAILDKADALRRKRQRAVDLLDSLTQSIFLEMFGDLTGASHFHVGTIADWVADFETGKNIAPDPDEKTGGYRVLKVSAVTKGRFDASEAKPLPVNYLPPADHIVRKNDLLFSRANTAELIGATAYVAETSGQLVLPDKVWRFVWPKAAPPNPHFIHALFSSPGFRRELSKRATGTSGSMKNISKEKVLSIPVSMPNRNLQDVFVAKAQLASNCGRPAREQLVLLDSVFASLQSRAFTGEL